MKCSFKFSNLQHDKFIPAIKEIRDITNWGLKESKDFVEATSRHGYQIFETSLTSKEIIESFDKLGIKAILKYITEDVKKVIPVGAPVSKNVVITDLREKPNHTTISLDVIPNGEYFTGTIVYNHNCNRYIGLFLRVNGYIVTTDEPHMCWDVITTNTLCENYQPVRVEILIKENL